MIDVQKGALRAFKEDLLAAAGGFVEEDHGVGNKGTEPVAGAQPTDVIQEGDTLVTVGKLGEYAEFRRLLAEGPITS